MTRPKDQDAPASPRKTKRPKTMSLKTPMNIRRAQAQVLREILVAPREKLSVTDAFKLVQSLGQLLKTIEQTDTNKRLQRIEKALEKLNASGE